jgi:L-lactate dehydrogenase complex protein LldG
MSAREAILARIRKAQGRGGAEPGTAERALVRDTIARHEIGPRPGIASAADSLAQFRKESARVSTSIAEVDSLEAVPAEVKRYLEGIGAATPVVGWSEFAGLGWRAAGVAFAARPATGDDRTGLTGCFCAIAETGTVLLLSSPVMPKTNALLPDTHICVVRRSRLVKSMEDAFALVRAEIGEPPRSMFMVSGPSRTADIEQTIVIGAHGPYRVHAILVP